MLYVNVYSFTKLSNCKMMRNEKIRHFSNKILIVLRTYKGHPTRHDGLYAPGERHRRWHLNVTKRIVRSAAPAVRQLLLQMLRWVEVLARWLRALASSLETGNQF